MYPPPPHVVRCGFLTNPPSPPVRPRGLRMAPNEENHMNFGEMQKLSFLVLLQITYYVLRRDTPEDWKCQPYHWLPKELEIHEIVVGAFSLAIGSLISSAMACWIMNGGWTKLYFDHTEHGYLWLLIQTPLVFIWQVNF